MFTDLKNSGNNQSGAAERHNTGETAIPSISAPKGGGAIRGIGEKFSANPVTGTGTLSIPIATSPGRSGFGPRLSLVYDSGASNGPFGLGWSLGLPAITRKTDKGLPRYIDADESDDFILSGSEDMVPVLELLGGSWVRKREDRTLDGNAYSVHYYRPRIEGLFARIERWTRADDGDTHWRSISKDNVTTFYGRTAESRIADSADPKRIFSWLICQSYDDKGNAILYDYVAEDSSRIDLTQAHERNRSDSDRAANRYLKRIRYGNQPSRLVQPDLSKLSWLFEVVLDYGEGHCTELAPDPQGREFASANLAGTRPWLLRRDPFSTYRPAFEVRTYRLCRRVLMFHHFPDELGTPDCLVRATEFGYSETAIASFIVSVSQSGFVRQPNGAYLKKSLPPLDLKYSEATVREDVREVDQDSLANLPAAVDGMRYKWLDLDGEGLQCVLAENSDGWYYKRNISPLSYRFDGVKPQVTAKFEPVIEIASLPAFTDNMTARHQFLDLAGDGQLDCVVLERPMSGFFERAGEHWRPFSPLPLLPNIDWGQPNLRFIDLDGDGRADVLITEHEVFTWHQSLAESGFGAAARVTKARDEEEGPAVVFADGSQAIYLADMSGDGLTDIVRIRNGEVCYWPNLGHGRFGRKILMDQSPLFEAQDQFDQKRVRLADIDGSGATDIIYLAPDGVRLYFNQSGNAWSDPQNLAAFPQVDDLKAVQALDLLGNGTACLVWTSSLPGDARYSMRYIDLMGGQKPHLLIHSANNMGAETRLFYAPSTAFYLADRMAGKPWVTRLPFPVQVVERVETYDLVSRNRFVTRYRYHHGFFDGVEREFRGFGMVEQIDTEELGSLGETGLLPDAVNIDEASYAPPVLTKTWFHTGAFLEGERVSRHFEREYYRESDLSEGVAGLTDEQAEAMLLHDAIAASGLNGDEDREACRSLKGAMLRQEIYALDNTDEADRPYAVSERNYSVKFLQPLGPNRHAVFYTHARETVEYHYERKLYDVGVRKLADPRVTHSLLLATDDFGNELQSVAIGYGRRRDDPDLLLTANDRELQRKVFVTYRESRYTNPILEPDAHRAPLPAETCVYELIKVNPDRNAPDITNLFTFDEIRNKASQASDGLHDLPYEDVEGVGAVQSHPYRRPIERTRTLYRKDDMTAALPLGLLESLALPFESYNLAFTPGLLALYQRGGINLLPTPLNVLRDEGGYILSDDRKAQGLFPITDLNGQWWNRTGRIFYSPNPAAIPLQELNEAREHFFLPRRSRDPFGGESKVTYDGHDLLALEAEDAMQNRITAGERGGAIANRNDYRVLQPALITDPNGNRSVVAFDALGLVAGSAVMGKTTETLGDNLTGFRADLTQGEVDAFFANPKGPSAAALLANATTRIVYDVGRFWRLPGAPNPAYNATIARETHVSDLDAGDSSRIQVGFGYSDGFGREIQRKIPAEPGPLAGGGPLANPRWVGGGWTVFNNKGNPVRQFEPFFDNTHDFRFGNAIGVSPTLFYDPVGRVVATLHPDHTWGKVVFDPWNQEIWDVNDTALTDPKTDANVGSFFVRLADARYLPTWHTQRSGGALGPDEQEAAVKAAAHAGTPSRAFFDTLGRSFMAVADNGPAGKLATRTELDIEGNHRSITDALARKVMTYDYDMLGARIRQSGVDAGACWTLNDVLGQPIRGWDSRDHEVRHEYDSLRRPVRLLVAAGAAAPRLAERILYGEGQPDDQLLNLRGRAFRHFDGAGVTTFDRYDFKGNLIGSGRQLIRNYEDEVDWAAGPTLEVETFSSGATFDALNRAATITTPDASVIRPAYNVGNLLERAQANLRGSATATPFVNNIDYDAKGRRVSIEYGNGTRAAYTYDPLTFRLTRLRTTRLADGAKLQDFSYFYDPVGNITSIRDAAQQAIYFNNQVVTADSHYAYDAVYRLTAANGREHIGQVAQPQTSWDDEFRVNLQHPHDGNAMRRYDETYEYDAAGNVLKVIHKTAGGAWTRAYAYDEPNPVPGNNRLTSATVGAITDAYTYDAHGNITSMSHLPLMEWTFKDELRVTQRQVVNGAPGRRTYYVYDAAGQRVRKVTNRANGARENERIYLGGFEYYREYGADGTTITLERETLHVMDDKRRIALVETRTRGNDGSPAQLQRFQFSNHLGSVALELDAAAIPISYEEYYPYGGASYQAMNKSLKAAAKRYRYTGKERDEETGFTYHGARYYAPWLGRWTSCDPVSIADGLNVYEYVSSNPVMLQDHTGTQGGLPAEYWEQTAQKERDAQRLEAQEKEERAREDAELDAGANGPQQPDINERGREPIWYKSQQEAKANGDVLAEGGAAPPELARKGVVATAGGAKETKFVKQEVKKGVVAGLHDAGLGPVLATAGFYISFFDLELASNIIVRPATKTELSQDVAFLTAMATQEVAGRLLLGKLQLTDPTLRGRSVGAAQAGDVVSGMNYGEAQAILKSVRRHTERLVFGRVVSNDPTVRRLTLEVQGFAAAGNRRAAGDAMHTLNAEFLRPLESPNLRVNRRFPTPGGRSEYRRPDYQLVDPSYPGGRPYGNWDLKPLGLNEYSYALTPQFMDIRGASGLGIRDPKPLYYRLPSPVF
jgi:RHS repeat-associated protein